MAKGLLHKLPQLVEFEEHVGKLWHRLITRSASQRYPEAAVHLDEVKRSVAVMFRALGGDGGLRIETSHATDMQARRSWLQRIAGSNKQVELAWRSEDALHLPNCIDVFPESGLNRDLYLWLAALASGDTRHDQSWFAYNQWLTLKVIKRFPGLAARYQRLLEAQLALRPALNALTADEAAQEQAIQAALQQPGQVSLLPPLSNARSRPLMPVYLWLHPCPPHAAAASPLTDEDGVPEASGEVMEPEEEHRYQAEQVEMPEGKSGLLLDRFENILSWAEYIKVDRTVEEEEDLDSAEEMARDLDQLSVARDSRSSAKRIRFDLDLPAADSDDLPLGEGILLPEWDYRKADFRKDYCAIQPMIARDAEPCDLPLHLRSTARRIRAQFETLQPTRSWLRGQQDGSEIDLDAFLYHRAEWLQGRAIAEQGMYRDFRNNIRDMSCLLLADLSLSTDAWVNNSARVIDVIRDSMLLFSEALTATNDQFAMYGFSSRRRDHVRVHTLKTFEEQHTAQVRGRIQAIKPGFYTRMGAAIRYTSKLLSQQSASQQLLIMLSDGKPNDLDQYESRYGVEDTRMALIEARQMGIQPFCVTIDERGGDYLPYIFGTEGYAVIRKPSELPQQLPQFYARLTS